MLVSISPTRLLSTGRDSKTFGFNGSDSFACRQQHNFRYSCCARTLGRHSSSPTPCVDLRPGSDLSAHLRLPGHRLIRGPLRRCLWMYPRTQVLVIRCAPLLRLSGSRPGLPDCQLRNGGSSHGKGGFGVAGSVLEGFGVGCAVLEGLLMVRAPSYPGGDGGRVFGRQDGYSSESGSDSHDVLGGASVLLGDGLAPGQFDATLHCEGAAMVS